MEIQTGWIDQTVLVYTGFHAPSTLNSVRSTITDIAGGNICILVDLSDCEYDVMIYMGCIKFRYRGESPAVNSPRYSKRLTFRGCEYAHSMQ